MRSLDLIDQRFGRLTVVSRLEPRGKRTRWLCKCDCGTQCSADTQSLRNGQKSSCGCLRRKQLAQRNYKHGEAYSKEFQSWLGMIDRCSNPSHRAFARYGGRGISVCDRWKEFKNFIDDMGRRPAGCSLDRIDNDAGYSPQNCRWATASEQSKNRSSNRIIEYDGERLCLSEWSKRVGIDRETIRKRIESGWSVRKALTTRTYGSYGTKVHLTP